MDPKLKEMAEAVAFASTNGETALLRHWWRKGYDAAIATHSMQATFDVDELAQEIRRVDGTHSLGAGALAEKLVEWIVARAQPVQAQGEPFAWYRTVNGVKAGVSFDQVHPDIDGWAEHPLYTQPTPAVDPDDDRLWSAQAAAIRTVMSMGYTWDGGERWTAPSQTEPVKPAPNIHGWDWLGREDDGSPTKKASHAPSCQASKGPSREAIDTLVYELRQAGSDDTYSIVRAALLRFSPPAGRTLTDEEIETIWRRANNESFTKGGCTNQRFARAILAASSTTAGERG